MASWVIVPRTPASPTTSRSDDLSWACSGSAATFTPVNPPCTKSGINVDGGIVSDISRSGALKWPPGSTAVQYQLDSIQGVGLQVELLYRNGYANAWSWSSSALKRMAGLVTRSGNAGGTGWNATNTSRQMPWLLNKRYGTSIPTQSSGMGRGIGFTDWLYGNGGGGSGSAPKPPKPQADAEAEADPGAARRRQRPGRQHAEPAPRAGSRRPRWPACRPWCRGASRGA